MINIKISEIADILGAEIKNICDDFYIKGVSRDSRDINEDNLYIPMVGERFDGHNFIEMVIEKGVKATLWSRYHRPIPENITCIIVDDTTKALQKLAKAYIERIGCKIIGITGSNGKTSIKDMCHSVLSMKYRCAKTMENYNNDIGLPLSILEANDNIDYMVLEMGMDRMGDIDKLVEIAPPDIAIISNIGTAHLQFLSSRENIAQGKMAILNNFKETGLFIKNGDEVLLNKDIPGTKTFGYNTDNDIYITKISQTFEGIDFDTNIMKNIHLNTFGKVQAENAMPVILMAINEGLNTYEIRKGLELTEFTKKRNDLYKLDDVYIYDDSYKSNPEGLYRCFETMKEFNIRKIAVLSDMAELGEREIDIHKEVAHKILENGIDKVYVYGRLSRYTYEECIALGVDAKFYDDKDDIALELTKEKDALILFKASNCMRVFDVISKFRRICDAKK